MQETYISLIKLRIVCRLIRSESLNVCYVSNVNERIEAPLHVATAIATECWIVCIESPVTYLSCSHGTPQPCTPSQTSDMGPPIPALPLASDIWWPSLETSSNLFTMGPMHNLPPTPSVLKSGGQSMYSWQVGSIHTTGRLSSYKFYFADFI